MSDTTAITAGLFEINRVGEIELLAGRCRECGGYSFPAASVCPYCGAEAGERVTLAGSGTIDLATEVTTRPPGYDGPIPYRLGVIELPEGIRIISRIASPDAQPGTPGRFVSEVLGEQDGRTVATYSFAPDPAAAPVPRTHPPKERSNRSLAAGESLWRGGRPVYISGVGIHPFGRFDDKTLTDLGVSAVRAALSGAGCERGGFQAAFCATVYGGVAAGHKVLSALGATGVPIVNVEAGCASGGAALGLAAAAIASGQYDTVLVLGMEKMPKGIIRSSFFEPWREQAGLAVTPAYFALRAQRLMRDSEITAEQLAQVSVKNHRQGVRNPYAMYRQELSVEQVMSSRLVCDPLRLYMLCSPNEGAAALLLSARPSSSNAVSVAAASLRSHLPGSVLGEHTPLSGLAGAEPPSATEMAAAEAFRLSGLSVADLDVVELQDTDSARELLSYEELGLCPPGGAGQWFAAGESEPDGGLPVNPSGGLLSKGEPLGASGLAQVIELYWQLRGEAGDRQLPSRPETGLAHTVGRGANASVVIVVRA